MLERVPVVRIFGATQQDRKFACAYLIVRVQMSETCITHVLCTWVLPRRNHGNMFGTRASSAASEPSPGEPTLDSRHMQVFPYFYVPYLMTRPAIWHRCAGQPCNRLMPEDSELIQALSLKVCGSSG